MNNSKLLYKELLNQLRIRNKRSQVMRVRLHLLTPHLLHLSTPLQLLSLISQNLPRSLFRVWSKKRSQFHNQSQLHNQSQFLNRSLFHNKSQLNKSQLQTPNLNQLQNRKMRKLLVSRSPLIVSILMIHQLSMIKLVVILMIKKNNSNLIS